MTNTVYFLPRGRGRTLFQAFGLHGAGMFGKIVSYFGLTLDGACDSPG